MSRLLLIPLAALALAACGGGEDAGEEMVWCVGPGEEVTAEFKQEYPELYMSKVACDAIERAAEQVDQPR